MAFYTSEEIEGKSLEFKKDAIEALIEAIKFEREFVVPMVDNFNLLNETSIVRRRKMDNALNKQLEEMATIIKEIKTILNNRAKKICEEKGHNCGNNIWKFNGVPGVPGSRSIYWWEKQCIICEEYVTTNEEPDEYLMNGEIHHKGDLGHTKIR